MQEEKKGKRGEILISVVKSLQRSSTWIMAMIMIKKMEDFTIQVIEEEFAIHDY